LFSDFRNGLEGCNFFSSCYLDVLKSRSIIAQHGCRPQASEFHWSDIELIAPSAMRAAQGGSQ
jgi:hypothetical protein